MNTNVIPAAHAAELQFPSLSSALGDQGDMVEVWEYFAEHIDDFATAKTIVDHFVENPKMLDDGERDLHGLFVRAKLTIKRQQIAYAQTQAAIETARQQSRGVRGVVKSFLDFTIALRSALVANPSPIVIGMGFGLLYWFR